MNSFVSLSLFYLLVAFAAEVSPANLGFCTIFDGVLTPVGQSSRRSTVCEEIDCKGHEFFEAKPCPPQIPRNGFALGYVIDATAPFPDCCRRAEIKLAPATKYLFEIQCPK